MPNENLLPLTVAIKSATGRKPHLSTALRWCQRPNKHGVRLESWVVGGRRVTSVEAVRRYVDATTKAANCKTLPSKPQATVGAAHDSAMQELAAMGI